MSFLKRHPSITDRHAETLKKLGVSLESLEVLNTLTENQILELSETLTYCGTSSIEIIYLHNTTRLGIYLQNMKNIQTYATREKNTSYFVLSQTFSNPSLVWPFKALTKDFNGKPDERLSDPNSELSLKKHREASEFSKILRPFPYLFSQNEGSPRTFSCPFLSSESVSVKDQSSAIDFTELKKSSLLYK